MSVKQVLGFIEEVVEYAVPVFRKLFGYGTDIAEWAEARLDRDGPKVDYSEYDPDKSAGELRKKQVVH